MKDAFRWCSLWVAALCLLSGGDGAAAETLRSMRFTAETPEGARRWQREAREKLFALMMGGRQPARTPLEAKVLRRVEVPAGGYALRN